MDPQVKYLVLAMFVQGLFPAILLLFMFKKRLKAVKDKQIHYSYFQTYQAQEKQIPQELIVLSNHYNNLFQMPVIFLVLGALSISLNLTDSLLVGAAWFYVVTRVIHTYIHIGSNYLPFRYTSFGVSCLVLLAMWVYLLGKVFSS